jgi:hypothetical protein
MTRPLHDLTRKNVPFVWGSQQQLAFEEMKTAFISAPVLTLWDPDLPTRIEVDASSFATGGIISQRHSDGLWHPIAFRSSSLGPAERNYQVYDREMLAVIEALKDWRHFLEGLPEPFEIVTDHSNLEYWRSAQNLNRRQARWALWLSRFDFRMVHRPGKANIQADSLSRQSEHYVPGSSDNREQLVLPPEVFAQIASTSEEFHRNPLEDRIRKASERESEVVKALEDLRNHGPRRLVNGLVEWEEEDGLVYYRGRVYVPDAPELRIDVVKQYHDHPTTGHPGIHETLLKLDDQFWWPSMRSFVKKYVDGCEPCHRLKHQKHPKSLTEPLPVPSGPWEVVGVDFITQLPNSHGYDAILTITDHSTKRTHAIPTTSEIDTDGTADLYYREIFRLHGLPSIIVSDRGPQFASKLMRALLRRLGIQSNLTTAYHPQANGQTERANQEIEKYLRIFTSRRQDDWDLHLPMAEFVINSRTHSAHDRSPFELDHGYLPRFNIPVGRKTGLRTADDRISHLQEARKDAEAALRLEKKHQKEDYERGGAVPHQFQVGDYVWLDSKDLRTRSKARKLLPLQLGPYRILRKYGKLSYKLDLPQNLSRLHPTFHVDKLSPWKGNDVNGLLPPPPEPVQLDDGEEWEVSEILDSRVSLDADGDKFLEYQIRWQGFGAEEDSWEPLENLAHAKRLVTRFHCLHPSAPRRINASLLSYVLWSIVDAGL